MRIKVDQLIAQHGYTATLDLLLSIPGLGQHGSEELLAEIGADMTVFPSPSQRGRLTHKAQCQTCGVPPKDSTAYQQAFLGRRNSEPGASAAKHWTESYSRDRTVRPLPHVRSGRRVDRHQR